MKIKRNITGLLAVLFSIFLVASAGCNKDDNNDDNNGNQGTADFNVKLSSSDLGRSIAVYDEVNVDIQKVSIHATTDTSATTVWFDLETNTGIYNLMDFFANDTLLAFDSLLEVQQVSQIRLLLGSNNTVVEDGETYDLDTPSGQTSGLKLQVNAALEPDKSYIVTLNFDPEESVKKTGNNKYILTPVISTTVIEQ